MNFDDFNGVISAYLTPKLGVETLTLTSLELLEIRINMRSALQELEATYMPKVKMTKKLNDWWIRCLIKNKSLEEILSEKLTPQYLYQEDNELGIDVSNLKCEDIVRAYLHPELIEVEAE